MELKPGMTFVKGEREYEYAGFRKNPDDPTKIQLVAHINPGIKGEALHRVFDPREVKDEGRDFWIGTELPYSEFARQYEEQVKILKDVGIITTIPLGTEDGIMGKDAFYPVPPLEDIQKKILENPEMYREKMQQGFTQMLLVPFATAVPTLINAFDQRLKHYALQNTLFPAKYSEHIPQDAGLVLPGKEVGAETSNIESRQLGKTIDWEKIKYDLRQFSERPNIITGTAESFPKKDILTTMEGNPLEGWQILFIQPNAWAQDNNHPIHVHKGLNKDLHRNIEVMRANHAFSNESGLTAEDVITYALFTLETKHILFGTRMQNPATRFVGTERNYLLASLPGADGIAIGLYNDHQRKYIFYEISTFVRPFNSEQSYTVRTAVRVT